MSCHDEIRDRIAGEARSRGLRAEIEHRTWGLVGHSGMSGTADVLIEGPEHQPLVVVEVKPHLDFPYECAAVIRQLGRYRTLFGARYAFDVVCPSYTRRAWGLLWNAGYWMSAPDAFCAERLPVLTRRSNLLALLPPESEEAS